MPPPRKACPAHSLTFLSPELSPLRPGEVPGCRQEPTAVPEPGRPQAGCPCDVFLPSPLTESVTAPPARAGPEYGLRRPADAGHTWPAITMGCLPLTLGNLGSGCPILLPHQLLVWETWSAPWGPGHVCCALCVVRRWGPSQSRLAVPWEVALLSHSCPHDCHVR